MMIVAGRKQYRVLGSADTGMSSKKLSSTKLGQPSLSTSSLPPTPPLRWCDKVNVKIWLKININQGIKQLRTKVEKAKIEENQQDGWILCGNPSKAPGVVWRGQVLSTEHNETTQHYD